MTMGTASTMTSITEALGLTLPGASSIPAADAAHPRMASACGRRIVEMVWDDLKPSDILTRKSVENALYVHNALAGSTNAMIHPRVHGAPGGCADLAAGFRRLRAESPRDRQSAPLRAPG